jgi:hypothetical protein
MNKITQWEHFKKNYLLTALVLIIMFTIVLLFEIARESEYWWISLFFLVPVIILPVGNYVSWKKKFNS